MSASFIVTDAGNNTVAGALSFEAGGALIVFTPSAQLANSTAYNVVMTSDCKDLAGTPFAGGTVLSFTTAAADSPPVVQTTIPAQGATDADPTAPIQIQMDKQMDITTITTA